MGALAERIARSRSATKATASSSKTATAFLPLCTIDDAVQSHPLFHAARLDVHMLHRFMVELETFDALGGGASPPDVPKTLAAARIDRNSCTQCSAPVELDAREGCVVCTSCGVVQKEIVFGASFESEPDVHCKAGPTTGKSFAAKLVEDARPFNYLEELRHWNHYTKLPIGEVERQGRLLSAMFPREHAQLVTVVCAALFCGMMRGKRVAEETSRETIADGKAPQRVSLETRKRQFPCSCGALEFTKKAARFHCKGRL